MGLLSRDQGVHVRLAPIRTPSLSPGDLVNEDWQHPSIWQRYRHGTRYCEADAAWIEQLGSDWPTDMMSREITDRQHAKQGRSIGRWTLKAAAPQLVAYVKRHYRLPRWMGWLALLWPNWPWSPGLSEARHLDWARQAGFRVPRTLAVAQFLLPGCRLQSMLAVEELYDMLPLHEAIPLAARHIQATQFSQWKRSLFTELARLSRELHSRSHFHRDLYLCHFYIATADCQQPPETWSGRVAMIDFHRLHKRRFFCWWGQAKDLGQFLFSTYGVEGINSADRDAFWKDYSAGSWGRARPRYWVWRIAQLRAQQNLRHNRKRQSEGMK